MVEHDPVAEQPPAGGQPPAPEQLPDLEPLPDPEQLPDLEPSAGPSPAPARRRSAAGVALAVAGLLVVTAASATVTVAVGKPDRSDRVAAAPAPSSAASTGTSPSASPSPTPTPSPTPSPTAAPRPVSTLQGSVSGGTHSGDLRYFLLPVPDNADPYGSTDGSMESMDDLQKIYGEDLDIKGILESWDFKEAATRAYRTRDGKMEVRTEIMRFARSSRAQGYADHSSYKLESFDIDGVPDAKGYIDKPEQQAYTGWLYGIGVVGDVVYEVHVMVQGDPDKALLAEAMKRQHDRLANG
ncbi:hypothetical protein BX266_3760 [Streptomyces sp. TLI_171]|nr:hypothetical protein BX266_3760 [Streptomyces sp. TLI_171]